MEHETLDRAGTNHSPRSRNVLMTCTELDESTLICQCQVHLKRRMRSLKTTVTPSTCGLCTVSAPKVADMVCAHTLVFTVRNRTKPILQAAVQQLSHECQPQALGQWPRECHQEWRIYDDQPWHSISKCSGKGLESSLFELHLSPSCKYLIWLAIWRVIMLKMWAATWLSLSSAGRV